MKRLPIGISDFKRLIEEKYYYVDKTLLIKEFLENTGTIALIPRPRRFGKTLNLSMLRYFFEQSSFDHSYLFKNTAIWQETDYKSLQGQYPVISLTFKDIKEDSWESTYAKIREVIATEFERHFPIIQESLPDYNLKKYTTLLSENANEEAYSTSLLFLSRVLFNYHKKRVIVLIDEYDAPIHEGYANNYYDRIVKFLRSLLTSVFKDNIYLERGVLTGILRAAKEGIFSGLNNLSSYTLINKQFQDKFGFTSQEVKSILKDQKLSDKIHEIQTWYNGYLFGSTTIYNPWSVLMCASERGLLQPYWLNTSDNQLVKKLITVSDEEVKKDLELLLSDQTIEKTIDEAIIFPGIEKDPAALWSLLLFTGYLTYTHLELKEGLTTVTLTIPNKEIMILYKNLIKSIFETSLPSPNAAALLKSLTTGDAISFAELLQKFISSSVSVYDLPSNEPEKSYHLFVLGLLVLLSDNYEIKSNRESGHGRYDIMIIPKKITKLGIVIEFKKVSSNETLELAAQKMKFNISFSQFIQQIQIFSYLFEFTIH